ncbi:serine O-acetyltransferase [Prescottella equi]|uniref:serine O-acetyltransferase n=1 Tax=Rhodococcus hoagii TaxID=43767 RepID=UPI0015849F93|nr:serine acetyltransferase [Prescottella equi]
MTPERLWLVSARLHRRGFRRVARIVKTINSVVYNNALPPEANVADDVRLWHHGLGVVIHPDTTIGRDVQIAQHVTIGAGSPKTGTPFGVVVEDGVIIATGAVVAPKAGHRLVIGAGAKVGANAVVTKDVPPGATVVGGAARILDPAAAS